jgi:hypothetical protein
MPGIAHAVALPAVIALRSPPVLALDVCLIAAVVVLMLRLRNNRSGSTWEPRGVFVAVLVLVGLVAAQVIGNGGATPAAVALPQAPVVAVPTTPAPATTVAAPAAPAQGSVSAAAQTGLQLG